tara:strand:+ start:1113 stop:1325 length:213 start_codon:yes stop_codon:yes gene_type:complete
LFAKVVIGVTNFRRKKYTEFCPESFHFLEKDRLLFTVQQFSPGFLFFGHGKANFELELFWGGVVISKQAS